MGSLPAQPGAMLQVCCCLALPPGRTPAPCYRWLICSMDPPMYAAASSPGPASFLPGMAPWRALAPVHPLACLGQPRIPLVAAGSAHRVRSLWDGALSARASPVLGVIPTSWPCCSWTLRLSRTENNG